MPNVNGGALEGYADGCTATFNKQYAVIRGNWNVAKSYSTGEKNQEFACRYALIPRTDEKGKARDAVVKGSVKVYVGDELWSPVDNIKSARPGDKVYQLDMTTGFFTFGDGEHGVIPEKGKQIKVDYYSSGADSLGPTQQAVIQAVAQDNLDNQKDGTGEFKFFSTPKPERKPQGGLPQTGDASTLVVAGGVAVGVATTIAGARARKRRV